MLDSATSALTLTDFLHELLGQGAVTMGSQLAPFAPADLAHARQLLHRYHAQDAQTMPHQAPAFAPAAAEWAAQLVYRAIQLVVLRDLDETVVQQELADFPAPAEAAAVYSADLMLRHLPDLLALAKGLAPGDALVARLRELGRQWPFSFVSTEIGLPEAQAVVLADASLRTAYIDRIIAARDLDRASQPGVRELVQQALGNYAAELWPDFPLSNQPFA